MLNIKTTFLIFNSPDPAFIELPLLTPSMISFNCCKCMFQQYCTRMNKAKEQVITFDNYAKSVLEYNFDHANVIKSDIIRDLLKIQMISIVFQCLVFLF